MRIPTKEDDNVVNPHVIIIDQKAFVGVKHGEPPTLTAHQETVVKKIATQYGAYYEGNGGDVDSVRIFGPKSQYAGSWDKKFSKSIKGYPPEFLYTLFTNVKENKQAETLTNPSRTIFESILNAQDKVSYLKDRDFDSKTLQAFLTQASERDVNFLDMAEQKATPKNVEEFLKTGESLMWPDKGWEKYPNKAGKLAKRVTDMRQEFLVSQPAGVFVVGSDHLKGLKDKI